MAAELHVFPDRREAPSNCREGALAGLSAAILSVEAGLRRLRRLDWRHPALVVYRENGDDRWSYVMVGLNSPEGLGEGE